MHTSPFGELFLSSMPIGICSLYFLVTSMDFENTESKKFQECDAQVESLVRNLRKQ